MTRTMSHVELPKLTGIAVYPLKSGSPRHLESITISRQGLTGDRRLMLVRPDGIALTGRDHPAMLSIALEFVVDQEGWQLTMDAPGMPRFHQRERRAFADTGTVDIWTDRTIARRGFEAADKWLKQSLGVECSLVAVTPRSPPLFDRQEPLFGFVDASPILLTSVSSLVDLNTRLPLPVDMERFRPNLVVTGYPAFDEDSWSCIRIGEIEFDVYGECARCSVVTTDPQTPSHAKRADGVGSPTGYRHDVRDNVFFGQLFIPRATGQVRLGQVVKVVARKPKPMFSLPSQQTSICFRRQYCAARPLRLTKRRLVESMFSNS